MEQLFGAISEVIANLEPDSRGRRALIFAAWRRMAGEAICARTVPLELTDDRLIIGVADETWRRHLEDLSPQMVAKINGLLTAGSVKRIEFRVVTLNLEL